MGFITRLLLVAFAMFAFGSFAQAAPSTGQVSIEQSTPVVGSYQEAAWWDRVCCKRGYHDWWTTRRDCRRSGGWTVPGRECRDDFRGDRVCCARHGRDWWARSARACYERGGHVVSRRACRWD